MRKFLVLGLEGSEEEESSSSSVWNGAEREKEGGDVSFVSFSFLFLLFSSNNNIEVGRNGNIHIYFVRVYTRKEKKEDQKEIRI